MRSTLEIKSPAFKDGEMIPAKYTCDGENMNPPFEISGVSELTKSLALIMDDPDAPMTTWVHWLKWNIPATVSSIDEGVEPEGVSGKGTGGNLKYHGPCPPSGVHHYFFKLYVLDTTLGLAEGSTKKDLERAIDSHVLQQAHYVGLYTRGK